MQQMDRQMNRQQKIMAAKASFQRTGDDAGFFYKRDLKEAEQLLNETKSTGPSFHFGLMALPGVRHASYHTSGCIFRRIFLSGFSAGIC